MANLQFRRAGDDSFDFAWSVCSRNIGTSGKRTEFLKEWPSFENKFIIQIDGKDIGWFSCNRNETELTIENLHVLPEDRGITLIVLNLLVLDGNRSQRTVLLRTRKDDPLETLFRREGFSSKSSGAHVIIDISSQLEHWHRKEADKYVLPWDKATEKPRPGFPSLAIKYAKTEDFEFAWNVYSRKAGPSARRAKFAEEWKQRDDKFLIQLDGKDIGWFSCERTNTQLAVDNLHIAPGNPGVPSTILNVLVADAQNHKQKVTLRLLKVDSALEFFRRENFPILENAADETTIDVSPRLGNWSRIWSSKAIEIPWAKIQEESK